MDPFLEKLKEHNGYLPQSSQFIMTKADKLLDCVDLAGEVKMENAARALDMSLDQIHSWVLAMEKKNILKLKFSLFHGIILVSNKRKKEGSLWNWL